MITFIANVVLISVVVLVLASVIGAAYFASERFGFVGGAVAFVLTFAFWEAIKDCLL